tara:strand:+ start:4627 stop:4956 length:330 start_codon:yes stop_codon:yes gene_type:complete
MKLDRSLLKKIISEEIGLVSEGCGCGCNGMPGGCGDIDEEYAEPLPLYIDDDSVDHIPDIHHHDNDEPEAVDTEFLTRDETLKAVVALAMSTSCPITRESLLSTVRELM